MNSTFLMIVVGMYTRKTALVYCCRPFSFFFLPCTNLIQAVLLLICSVLRVPVTIHIGLHNQSHVMQYNLVRSIQNHCRAKHERLVFQKCHTCKHRISFLSSVISYLLSTNFFICFSSSLSPNL